MVSAILAVNRPVAKIVGAAKSKRLPLLTGS
jgi:antitoxin (DNA-binding transcriptional repressor) of toxin-antitoxin stability system